MAEEYSSAEIYEAQFFQLQNEEDMASLDDRPLKIMNLTKKISSKNNFSNFEEEDAATTHPNTQPGDFFVNEPMLQDYQ